MPKASTARRRAERRWLSVEQSAPGVASHYLHDVASLLQTGGVTAVVLYCRVSARSKKYKSRLRNQAARLRRWAALHGVREVGCYSERLSGWRTERLKLGAAIEAARASGTRTVVLAESPDRYVRRISPVNQYVKQIRRPLL